MSTSHWAKTIRASDVNCGVRGRAGGAYRADVGSHAGVNSEDGRGNVALLRASGSRSEGDIVVVVLLHFCFASLISGGCKTLSEVWWW